MNRHTNWMDEPITWGSYLKLAAICTVIGTGISAAYCVVFMEPAWWRTLKDFVRRVYSR